MAAALCGAACTERTPSELPALPPASRTIIEGGSELPARLSFGLSPALADAAVLREYGEIVAYLSDFVGIPIDIKVVDTYGELAASLMRFETHIAILPPYSYVKAKQELPSLVLLASEVIDGALSHTGYIIVRDDSGIDSIEDLRGKRFAFVDPQSTTGYLYPLIYLHQQGIEMGGFFRRVVFTGDHKTLISMVLANQIDAGATYATAVKLAALEQAEGKRIRILAKTGRAPLDAYCANPRLAQPLIDALREGLLSLSTRTEEGRRVLRGATLINGFVAVRDDNYDEVRRIAETLEHISHP